MDRVNTTAFISGIMIGIGNVIYISVDNKYVGAMLFSLALLTIIQNKCQLYTGQIGYIREKTYSIFDWTMMFLLNCVGATYSTILGLLVQDNAIMIKFLTIAQNKFSRSYVEIFICGILCGILMFVAVKSNNQIITIFCIMTFLLSGYEHCIASFPYLIQCPSFNNILKFLLIVLGNSLGSVMMYVSCQKNRN